MTNEIKEILDDLKYVSNEIKVHIQDGNIKAKEIPSSLGKELRLNNYSAKALLDYITNLQEENKGWEMIFDTFSRRPYAHKYLEEKRKELNNDKIVGLDSESIYKDYYNLKQRIDKAVEYIKWNLDKNEELIEYFNYDANFNELLDILRGDE